MLVPQEEDFGMAMVEALAAGTPVIAYDQGGAREIVGPGLGVLYRLNSVAGLIAGIKQREAKDFDSAALHQASRRYSARRFADSLTRLVEETRR